MRRRAAHHCFPHRAQFGSFLVHLGLPGRAPTTSPARARPRTHSTWNLGRRISAWTRGQFSLSLAQRDIRSAPFQPRRLVARPLTRDTARNMLGPARKRCRQYPTLLNFPSAGPTGASTWCPSPRRNGGRYGIGQVLALRNVGRGHAGWYGERGMYVALKDDELRIGPRNFVRPWPSEDSVITSQVWSRLWPCVAAHS